MRFALERLLLLLLLILLLILIVRGADTNEIGWVIRSGGDRSSRAFGHD